MMIDNEQTGAPKVNEVATELTINWNLNRITAKFLLEPDDRRIEHRSD
jgi:hypothetical protein